MSRLSRQTPAAGVSVDLYEFFHFKIVVDVFNLPFVHIEGFLRLLLAPKVQLEMFYRRIISLK